MNGLYPRRLPGWRKLLAIAIPGPYFDDFYRPLIH
jgi:hypothetical protein